MIEAKRRKGKRADGEGSLRYVERKRLWAGRLMVGHRPDGRPDIREVSAKTQAECRKRLQELRERHGNSTLPDAHKGGVTVGQYLRHWSQAVKANVRSKTARRYGELVERHLIPGLGRHKVSALRPDHLTTFYESKLANLSPQTITHLHRCLHTALNAAVAGGYVTRNVAAVVRPPRVARREIRPPSPEMVANVLQAAEVAGDRLAALWEVASLTGARQGELLGLRWTDTDLDGASMRIERALVGIERGTAQPTFDEPKTTKSRRTIPLEPEAVEALKAHGDRQAFERQKLGEAYQDHNLVFCTKLGTPLDATNVVKYWRDACKRAGVDACRFHDLRHFAITTMLLAGIPVNVVSETVGHHSPAMTLGRYGHLLPGSKAQGTAALGEALRRARRQAATGGHGAGI